MQDIQENTYAVGESDIRPWGEWEVLASAERFVIKRITVKPSQRLSLQWHHHRDEHWIVLEGQGRVTLGDARSAILAGCSIFIPRTMHHRIENPGSEDLVFIEIQTGDLLDEGDIERIEDIYGRVS